jgi:hypothetical protein
MPSMKEIIQLIKNAIPDLLSGVAYCVAFLTYQTQQLGKFDSHMAAGMSLQFVSILALCILTSPFRQSRSLWKYVLAWLGASLAFSALSFLSMGLPLQVIAPLISFTLLSAIVSSLALYGVATLIQRSRDKSSAN